jgi:fructose-1,6-bisphosphatase/inositol monophosphatase family enzyme
MGWSRVRFSMDADAQLALLRRMADAVAEVVREAPAERFGDELGMGADGTATKMVDDLAEREILRLLREERHGLNLLSEEAGFVDFGGDKVVVADPIDGTTNAARGIPFYCVSLAVGTRSLSDIETGLVLNLATGDRYEAVLGQGATLNGRRLRVQPPGDEVVLSIGFQRGSDYLPPPGILRSLGASAMEMALVASGGLDGYHYAKPILRVIDVAAATLLVREAGGVVVDRMGKDLELPLSLVPRFGLTAASTRELAAKMVTGGKR